MNYLDGLNDEQKQAVLHIDGPLLIVAGAGTGKTKTITHRIYHLIQSGVDPRAILAITFTNKAAAEMLERIRAMHSEGDTQPMMKTFHSLGVYLLRRHADVLGYSKWFTILDSADSLSMVKRAMEARDINPKQWDPKRIRNMISSQKGNAISHLDFAGGADSELGNIVAEIWTKYEEMLKRASAFDFDDLLVKAYELLRDHKNIRDLYRKYWRYVHVDEYQDTNEIQYKLAKLLTGDNMNICVVGDGDQNIYSWRGANIKNILNFEKDFPGAKSIALKKNYRSTKTILSAADEIIRKNKKRLDRELITDNEQGNAITIYTAFSETDEAAWVAGHVQGLIEMGTEPRDIAILFRTNFQSRVMEESFLQLQIPYQVLGTKFFDRKEVKDTVAYLRAALNPDSLPDIARTINEPKRGLGKASVTKIFANQLEQLSPGAAKKYDEYQKILSDISDYARKNTPADTIKYVMRISGYEDMLKNGSADDIERLENLKELVTFASRYEMVAVDPDMGDPMLQVLTVMLEDVALMSDQDKIKDGPEGLNAVRLMTIHASKGLEFRYVFIVGLEQGLFPSDIGGNENRDDEEERRLMYVAITRAKEKLYMSHAQIRRIFGEQRIQEPSEFLSDIPDKLFEIQGFGGGGDPEKTVYLDW